MQVRSLGWEDPLEHGNLLKYSCWDNPMNRGAWWATVHGLSESDTTEHAHTQLVLNTSSALDLKGPWCRGPICCHLTSRAGSCLLSSS